MEPGKLLDADTRPDRSGMSSTYIQRLRGVQSEYDAIKMSITFFEQYRGKEHPQQIGTVTPRDFVRAELNLEATYFIRLYAEFEGILKDHLATNHRRIKVPDKPKVDWLLSRVLQAEGFSLEPLLRARLDAVRDYRNSVTHRTRRTVAGVSFTDSLSALNTFLARLPEPLN